MYGYFFVVVLYSLFRLDLKSRNIVHGNPENILIGSDHQFRYLLFLFFLKLSLTFIILLALSLCRMKLADFGIGDSRTVVSEREVDTERRRSGETELRRAAFSGELQNVVGLVEGGCEVNGVDEYGMEYILEHKKDI